MLTTDLLLQLVCELLEPEPLCLQLLPLATEVGPALDLEGAERLLRLRLQRHLEPLDQRLGHAAATTAAVATSRHAVVVMVCLHDSRQRILLLAGPGIWCDLLEARFAPTDEAVAPEVFHRDPCVPHKAGGCGGQGFDHVRLSVE